MKIAKEIAEEQERRGVAYLDDLYACFDKGVAESIIAARLEPVKKLLERIKADVVCEGVPLIREDEDDNECSPKMALRSIGGKAIAALTLFEDE